MQVLFISDLHGIIDNVDIVSPYLKSSNYIVLLGDIFYSGMGRNFNYDYNPTYLKEELNKYKDKIISVEGNMDGYDEGIEFESSLIKNRIIDGHQMYFTHGHYYHSNDIPNIKVGDIFISGHTHKPVIKKDAGILYLNPGSLSLPRNEVASFMIYKNNEFIIYDIKHNIIDQIKLQM